MTNSPLRLVPPPVVASRPQSIGPLLPRSYTLEEFSQQDFPEHAEIIAEHVLPVSGKFLVGALKGVGKTILLGQTAYEIASGVPWMGLFDIPEPLRVMIIQKEVADVEFMARMNQVGKHYLNAKPENIMILKREDTVDIKLDNAKGIAFLEGLIVRDAPDVVMLDPIVWFHDQDEDKSIFVKRILAPLSDLQARYGTTFMISHHLKKPSMDYKGKKILQSMQDFRGSGVWADWADSVLWMNEVAPERVLLDMFLRHGRTEPPTLVLQRNRKYATFDAEIQDHPTDMGEYEAISQLQNAPLGELRYTDLLDKLKGKKLGPRQAMTAVSSLVSKNLAYYVGTNGNRIVRPLTPSVKVWMQ